MHFLIMSPSKEFWLCKGEIVFEVGGEYMPPIESRDENGVDDLSILEVEFPSLTRMFIDVC